MISKKIIWLGALVLLPTSSHVLAGVNPPVQQVLDSAKYWDERGRPDLADKIRAQLHPAVPVVTSQGYRTVGPIDASGGGQDVGRVVSGRQAVTMASEAGSQNANVVAPVTQSGKQDLLTQADYWDQRGRGDLADQLRNQAHSTGASNIPTTESVRQGGQKVGRDATRVVRSGGGGEIATTHFLPQARSMPGSFATTNMRHQNVPVAKNTGPAVSGRQQTQQELSARAQYWQGRGRSDLAGEIRQKLQVGTVSTHGMRDADVAEQGSNNVVRSALENSVQNSPDSAAVKLDLAQIYMSAGDLAKARAQIDSVLLTHPDSSAALFASAQLYSEQRMWRETLDTLENISPASRNVQMARLQKTAWAHVQIDRADALVRQGSNAEAEVLLRRVAAELAINYSAEKSVEPPPLWGADVSKRRRKN